MERKWIIYDEPPPLVRNGLYLSMNKVGELMLGRGSYESLGQPEAVYLMYDPETNVIGMKKTEPMMTNAFPLRAKGKSGNYVVAAKPLCVKHEIKYDCTVQFLETSIEKGALVAHLHKTRKIQKRRGPKAGSGR